MGGKRGKDRLDPASHPISGPSANASVQDLFAGTGEMAALMCATDWSKTRLGPVEKWPQSLRTKSGLGSRFPMLLWWGPHLKTFSYSSVIRCRTIYAPRCGPSTGSVTPCSASIRINSISRDDTTSIVSAQGPNA